MELYDPEVVEIGFSMKPKPPRLLSTSDSHSYWIPMIQELSNLRVSGISNIARLRKEYYVAKHFPKIVSTSTYLDFPKIIFAFGYLNFMKTS